MHILPEDPGRPVHTVARKCTVQRFTHHPRRQ